MRLLAIMLDMQKQEETTFGRSLGLSFLLLKMRYVIEITTGPLKGLKGRIFTDFLALGIHNPSMVDFIIIL